MLALFIGFSSLTCHSDAREEITRRYFAYLNATQIKQAKDLTDSSFVFENFEGRKKTRMTYFEEFERKIALHPITTIHACIPHENYVEVWGENSSDYNIYLDFDALPSKYTISFKNEKIQRIYFDSLPGYTEKRNAMQLKTTLFQQWLAQNHPEHAAEFQRNGYMKAAPELLKAYTSKNK